ncbi:hypothetical protein JST97_23120, partial [bacterium]|nr:hypothetical protein [bacterium]
MKEIGTRMTGLSTLSSRPQSKNLAGGTGPAESFSPAEAAPGLMKKPQFPSTSAAEKAEASKRGLSTGKTLGLVAATLAAGAGVVGLANAHPGPTHAQIQLSERDAQKADKNFSFLSEVVTKQGGSLKADPNTLTGRVFHQQRAVDARGATRALAEGYTVYVYPSSQSEQGIPIQSLDDLKQITAQARSEVAQSHLKQGLESLKDGINQVGKSIQ